MLSFAILAVASLASSASALVIPRASVPATYNEGYLEKYSQYNGRYLALDCEHKHNTQFFTDCCHPMLATENLKDNRKPYCTPSASASSSAAQAESTSTVQASGDPDCDDDHSSSTADPTSTSAAPVANVAPSPSPEPSPSSSSSPAPAPSPSPPSGGGVSGTGIATFFYQNGVAGNCGQVHLDTDHVVALQTDAYGNGEHCGKTITITDVDTGHTASAIVADSCPTCAHGQIDLSYGLFLEFTSADAGTFDVKWEVAS